MDTHEADYWRLNQKLEDCLDALADCNREIEVLTTERDNALLRIEELELRNAELALTLHDIGEHS